LLSSNKILRDAETAERAALGKFDRVQEILGADAPAATSAPAPAVKAAGLRSGAILDVRAVIRRDRRDHVADPPEQPARTDPHLGCHDQPEDAAQEVAVVELPD